MRHVSLRFSIECFCLSLTRLISPGIVNHIILRITVLLSLCAIVITGGTAIASVSPQITAGEYHSVGLKSDGNVWAWGNNDYGQLGDGTKTDSTIPVQVSGLGDVTAITAGGYHSTALTSDSTVLTWGWNAYGQLGDGSKTNSAFPLQVSSLSGITAVAGGAYHSIALKSDGTIWTWGGNGYGQLGDGTNTNSTTPVQVSGLAMPLP